MKKFSFPLDRVLEWRQTQARLEEATLAKLNAELQARKLSITSLDRSVRQAQSHLLGLRSASPVEIGALEHFRNAARAQTGHLGRESQILEAKIAKQTQIVVEQRRNAQLLQRLREKQLKTWQQAADREVEQQAEESYLARFTRSSNMQSSRPMR